MTMIILRPIGYCSDTGYPCSPYFTEDCYIANPTQMYSCQFNFEQYPNSGEHWDKIDEVTHDGLGTYVFLRARYMCHSHQEELYEIEHPSVSGNLITQVTISGYLTTYNSVDPSVRSHTVGLVFHTHHSSYYQYPLEEYVNSENEGWGLHTKTFTVNPYTGLPWTWAEINDLNIGTNLSMAGEYWLYYPSQARMTQLWAEVTYDPTSWVLYPSDSISLSDTPSKLAGLGKADALSISDILNSLLIQGGDSWSLNLYDSLFVSDTVNSSLVKAKIKLASMIKQALDIVSRIWEK